MSDSFIGATTSPTITILNPDHVLLSLLSCLELAADHPDRELNHDMQSDLLRLAYHLTQALIAQNAAAIAALED
ncbi:hypothetical protein [Dichelobacter nodosus]|uniref:hypothetical protein n=1 Tax=Dichelobacter nodosus TaxID=870 RepID=UPI00068106DF|nr:hypothetical protein [Dichelobacter nodosus]AXM45826.1 virulence-associated protein VapG1 [Dichelobacter nodosus]KNZ39271.1 hypothetical protein AKG33_06040 [Dichelobacter nodosus]TGA64719.1 virulence-associated protein VapG1 [Dichelobacter nodosus]